MYGDPWGNLKLQLWLNEGYMTSQHLENKSNIYLVGFVVPNCTHE